MRGSRTTARVRAVLEAHGGDVEPGLVRPGGERCGLDVRERAGCADQGHRAPVGDRDAVDALERPEQPIGGIELLGGEARECHVSVTPGRGRCLGIEPDVRRCARLAGRFLRGEDLDGRRARARLGAELEREGAARCLGLLDEHQSRLEGLERPEVHGAIGGGHLQALGEHPGRADTHLVRKPEHAVLADGQG